MTPAALVTYDPDALLEFEGVKGRKERKAVFTVVEKLRCLGSRLPSPHMKSLKDEPGLMELRPRQGASPVRPIYRRTGSEEFVILAFAIKADKADFDAAVANARERAQRYE